MAVVVIMPGNAIGLCIIHHYSVQKLSNGNTHWYNITMHSPKQWCYPLPFATSLNKWRQKNRFPDKMKKCHLFIMNGHAIQIASLIL